MAFNQHSISKNFFGFFPPKHENSVVSLTFLLWFDYCWAQHLIKLESELRFQIRTDDNTCKLWHISCIAKQKSSQPMPQFRQALLLYINQFLISIFIFLFSNHHFNIFLFFPFHHSSQGSKDIGFGVIICGRIKEKPIFPVSLILPFCCHPEPWQLSCRILTQIKNHTKKENKVDEFPLKEGTNPL